MKEKLLIYETCKNEREALVTVISVCPKTIYKCAIAIAVGMEAGKIGSYICGKAICRFMENIETRLKKKTASCEEILDEMKRKSESSSENEDKSHGVD